MVKCDGGDFTPQPWFSLGYQSQSGFVPILMASSDKLLVNKKILIVAIGLFKSRTVFYYCIHSFCTAQ